MNITKKDGRAETHYEQGLCYFNKEREVQKAKHELKLAIRCDKGYIKAYKALAECFQEEANTEKAKATLERALQFTPQDPSIIGKLGIIYKEERKFVPAAQLLKRALRWESDRKRALFWEKSLNKIQRDLKDPGHQAGWKMARGDAGRSSWVGIKKSAMTPLSVWSRPDLFKRPLEEGVMSVPSPVISDGVLIAADCCQGAFLGVDIETGESVWSSGRLIENFRYFNSPVIVQNHQLLFLTDGCLKGADVLERPVSFQDLMIDKEMRPSRLATPLAYEEIAVFCLERRLLIYDSLIHKGHFIEIELQENDTILSPALWGHTLIILSHYGTIFRVNLKTLELAKKIKGKKIVKGHCSPPCVKRSYMYFECFDENRWVCAYDLEQGTLVKNALEQEYCSPDHLHFHSHPVAVENGVLFSSDNESPPTFFRVQREGQSMDINKIKIDVRSGNHKVFGVSHVFTAVAGHYIISKTGQGFFYYNITDSADSGMIFFPSETEMLTQPIIDQEKLFLICRDGVRCYHL